MRVSQDLTPMMKQYRRIRAELPPGTILLFRLGDFYECFYEDAREAAALLEITLTRRQGVPMCGVPFHSVDAYVARLIRAGRKAAICDQVEDPALAKGIVKREVTRIVTPGTATEEGVLQAKEHHYLAALCCREDTYALALLDLSTGDFSVEESHNPADLRDACRRALPAECLFPSDQAAAPWLQAVLQGSDSLRTALEEWVFEADAAADLLKRHFGVHSLDGFGCAGRPAAIGAAAGALYYVQETLRRKTDHIRALRHERPAEYLWMDEATIRNLDLLPTGRRGIRRGGDLLSVLDTTCTPMGGRLLREWLLRPLAQADPIVARHQAVEELRQERTLLADLRSLLSDIRDLERLIARLAAGSGNARDLKALGRSLAIVPAVRDLLTEVRAPLLRESVEALSNEQGLVEELERALEEELPLAVREGGLIRAGYNAELDELRRAATEGKQWLAEYQAREIERTGIRTLKVRHNRVFGYYIEISKAQAVHAPSDYIRRQTLTGAERFVTPVLQEYEKKIVGAQERAMALEYEIFCVLRDRAVERLSAIQQTAAALARLDVLATFAERAIANRYVRPSIRGDERIRIHEGRHPIVEALPDAERFVPNDTLLDTGANQLLIITGPNMAGKSTYIRQVALIVILAQAGSFVPATEAEIGVVDRLFTRAGAGDDLAGGRSTFLVEMQETANILHHATPRSLIVLDEIGRGTSTFDGISIAWAVAEYLHNTPAVKAKTLFATHYHELTDLALTLPGVKNYTCLARETGKGVVFLRRIVPGAADKSYGIHVARLAGLPPPVIERAEEVLQNLEEGELEEAGKPKLARRRNGCRSSRFRDAGQLPLFGETL